MDRHQRHRPAYHYLPPANWMNDPNGLIHWKGKYHLFYQYNPDGPFHGNIHWGHAASTDLVHWSDLPIALAPTPGSPDEGGCWSGCAVDDNGTPTLVYTGFSHGMQLPCLARSDDDLIIWTKDPGNPVSIAPPAGLDVLGFRDHSLWRENGQWYQVIGSGIRGRGGAVLLYRSRDLSHWEYLHPLTSEAVHQQFELFTGSFWECPSFFQLGRRHVLVVSALHEKALDYAVAFLGRYEASWFVPEALQKLDWGDRCFYAPQTMLDELGRRLMWGWLQEERPRSAQLSAGWSGVMSLPRVLTLDGSGDLRVAFAPELQALRGEHYHAGDIDSPAPAGATPALPGGPQLEIILKLEPLQTGQSGLRVLLADPVQAFRVAVCYRLTPEHDIMERWCELENLSPAPVTLDVCHSASLHLPAGTQELTYVAGAWAREFTTHRERLPAGTLVLESRSLQTGHTSNPFFSAQPARSGLGGKWHRLLRSTGVQRQLANGF